ncbi:hypothetical protein ACWD4G_23960 [Streptomyces sp. NPDC002643]
MIESTPHRIRADEARTAITDPIPSRASSAGRAPSWASTLRERRDRSRPARK